MIETLRDAGGDRVAVYDLENAHGTPIYVHAKVCVIDDVWLVVGSDNLNRRSWTHDSELSCAVLDADPDEREPLDPAGLGDGARVLARDTRLRLWREHLGRDDGDVADLVDPARRSMRGVRRPAALDAWHDGGRHGPRPPGHARFTSPSGSPMTQQWWSHTFHRALRRSRRSPAAPPPLGSQLIRRCASRRRQPAVAVAVLDGALRLPALS